LSVLSSSQQGWWQDLGSVGMGRVGIGSECMGREQKSVGRGSIGLQGLAATVLLALPCRVRRLHLVLGVLRLAAAVLTMMALPCRINSLHTVLGARRLHLVLGVLQLAAAVLTMMALPCRINSLQTVLGVLRLAAVVLTMMTLPCRINSLRTVLGARCVHLVLGELLREEAGRGLRMLAALRRALCGSGLKGGIAGYCVAGPCVVGWRCRGNVWKREDGRCGRALCGALRRTGVRGVAV